MSDDKEKADLGDRIPGHEWWQQRSQTEKKCTTLCIVLSVVAFLLLIVTIVTSVRLRNAQGNLDSICNTEECVEAAAEIIDYIDPSLDPCEDFYQFTCGNFLKKSIIPDDAMSTSTVGNMQEDIYIDIKKLVEVPISRHDTEVTIKTKNLYASCMNSSIEDGSVDALRSVLDRVGGWPIVDSKWLSFDLNLERRLAILWVHGITPFVGGYVMKDENNITDFILQLYSGSLILRDQFYVNESVAKHADYLESYKDMIISTARLLDGNEATIQKDVEDILRFEKEYAKISDEDTNELTARWERNETETDDRRYSINQLERAMPKIKWSTLIDYVFEYLEIDAKKDDISLTVRNMKFMRSLTGLIKKTTLRTLANYLTWRFVFNTMPYLDVHFRRLYYDFHKEVPVRSRSQFRFSRWRECVDLVSSIFTMPLTSLYVKENFDEERKDGILELIAYVKRGWKGGIYKQKWLDLPTKNLCEEKINKLKTKIGFPRVVLKPDELAKDYSGLAVSRDRFMDNMLKLSRLKVETEMSVLTGKKRRGYDWIDDPLSVNAYYAPGMNTMIFPLAMLRSPVYIPRRPKYINYARMGVVIGHEIGHGFDTNGRRISPNNEFEPWWKEEFIDKYEEKATCIVEQYSKFPIEMTDEYLNGNQTINDDIADNSGVQNAYRAYKMFESEHGEQPRLPGLPYSTSQLFFIAYGQVWCELFTKKGSERYIYGDHSPGRARINGPLMNTQEFAKAFNCPVGSPMNPEEKCNLWG